MPTTEYKIYFLFNNSTKKYLIPQDSGSFLVKTDINECVNNGLYPTISTLNNVSDLLPDNYKSLMYKVIA